MHQNIESFEVFRHRWNATIVPIYIGQLHRDLFWNLDVGLRKDRRQGGTQGDGLGVTLVARLLSVDAGRRTACPNKVMVLGGSGVERAPVARRSPDAEGLQRRSQRRLDGENNDENKPDECGKEGIHKVRPP